MKRLEWRKSSRCNKANCETILADGVQLFYSMKSASGEFGTHKRYDLLLIGFVRELFSFAIDNNLSQRSIPMSVEDCVRELDNLYKRAVESGFCFPAARAMQQYLTFQRMVEIGRLDVGESLRKRFNEENASAAYDKMAVALSHLRDSEHWQDSDLPSTIRIHENNGKYLYQMNLSQAEIETAMHEILELKSDVGERIFKNYINDVLRRMKEYIDTGQRT